MTILFLYGSKISIPAHFCEFSSNFDRVRFLVGLLKNICTMKASNIVLVTLIFLPVLRALGQEPVSPKTQDNKKVLLTVPEASTEYSITSYKNVDFFKTDPLKLEAAGLHPEIYISNTHRGVIIISTAEANKTLKDFRHTLELNPNYFETYTRQDTIVFSPENKQNQPLDFTKASSIRYEYQNAFNYLPEPGTAIRWSKGTHKDFLPDDPNNKVVYDLIIVLPKTMK